MIPPLDARGLVPEGIYDSTWEEISDRFATNAARMHRLAELRRFLRNELQSVAAGLALYLGGSYFTDKDRPGDIDCTIYISPSELAARVPLLTLCSGHGGKGRIWYEYGVEIYPSIGLPGCNDFRLFFQYVGEKTAALKSLSEKDKRGIIKVESWILG